MAGIKKLDLKSKNITEEQKAKLKGLFPEVFTEDKIDFDKLRLTLGSEVDDGEERFGMTWPGKRDCFKVIQEPSIGTLKPCRDESVNWDKTENLFIEGDNLEVLKLLQKSYYGKVKVLCIDPPYNTGNEFIYPDKFSESLETYFAYTGQVDAEGRKFSTNTEADGRFHSKWLNMMYPRLFLARNLLRDDGVIFIFIDDNEVANLRKICDEIYGEENFVANVVWQKKTSPDARMEISPAHDHIIVYTKTEELFRLNALPMNDERKKNYTNPDNDQRGPWASVDLTGQTGRAPKSQFYKIKTPSGIEMSPPDGRCWALAEYTFQELFRDNRIWFGKSGNNRPRLKKFLSETEGVRPWTWWDNKSVGHNQEGNQEVKRLFDDQVIFDNPKPVRLLQRIVQLSTQSGESDIVLDFFAGSGTLAHATLAQNLIDNGSCRFVLIQLPEPVSSGMNDFKSDSIAFKLGYSTIADITKERIRRVIKKIEKEQDGKLDFGEPKQDLGFKVFKLNKSNFKIWDGNIKDKPIQEQLKLAIDHIDPNSKEEDILYEILIKSGFELTTPVEKLTVEDKKVYSVAEGTLLICLEKTLTKELIRAIAEKEPHRVVCLDSGFKGNDQLKTNAVQIMKSFKVESFRTV